jgi:hypothetical protein
MRRGRKSSGGRTMDCSTRRESEGDKNRDKKIAMIKLIIQKNHPSTTTKSSVCSAKVLTYPFGVQSWYWRLVF